MKKINTKIVLGFIALIFICFTTCNMENPIMEKWWVDPDPHDPYAFFQNIKVITIQYVIFAGNQTEFNNPTPGPGASTSLPVPTVNFNTAIIEMAAQLLNDNPEYRVMLHGHANPTTADPAEIPDLVSISMSRAISTSDALREEFKLKGGLANELNARMRIEGYGGGMTINDPNNPEVNRRVEVLIFTIENI